MEIKSSIFRGLIDASLFLALITSILYTSGAMYIQSYLSEWGVDSSLIETKPQELLIRGAVNFLIGGLNTLSTLFIIGIGLTAISSIAYDIFDSTFYSKNISKHTNVIFPKNDESLEPPFLLTSLKKWASQYQLFFICFFVLIILFYYLLNESDLLGKKIAKKDYIEFSTGNISNKGLFSKMKTVKINGEETDGYILANSDSLVAVYLKATETKPEQVLVIPLNSINNIRAIKN